jgi:hypothetical protein
MEKRKENTVSFFLMRVLRTKFYVLTILIQREPKRKKAHGESAVVIASAEPLSTIHAGDPPVKIDSLRSADEWTTHLHRGQRMELWWYGPAHHAAGGSPSENHPGTIRAYRATWPRASNTHSALAHEPDRTSSRSFALFAWFRRQNANHTSARQPAGCP